ncbi:MAG: PAS domain-containing protein [Chloroflexales bacterium]|nr:PAS domain-containing protein [Chloroflexales bacterium]
MDDNDTTAALQAEITSLKQQLADMQSRAAEELRQSQALLQGFIENIPSGVSVVDRERRILLINRQIEQNMGISRDQIVGKLQEELFPQEVVDEWAVSDRQVFDSGQPISAENVAPLPDGDHTFMSIKFPLADADGHVYAIGNIVTDITDQKRAEHEQLALREEIIAGQQSALRELSTPLIPIAKGVVAMPIVGAIDSRRAQQIMESLLEGISALQAETAILDITGVRVVDTQVAQALLQAAKAAELLGAQVVLTGIGAEVAQSLVQLGADMSSIVTRSNLQAGIAFALESRQ